MQNKGYFFWAWNDLDKWRHNSVAGVTPTLSPTSTKIAAPEYFDDFKMVIDQTLLQGTFRYLSLLWVKPYQIQLTPIIAMLWFNFILGLISISNFPLF